jgi:hypothetical protein
MFPDLNNYDNKDTRQLILYSWHFDLYAIKKIIEVTKNNIDDNIKKHIKIAQSNLDNIFYDEAMKTVAEFHNIEPITYQSYLLSLYSVVEASLDRYCDICKSEMNLKISLEDFKDKGITRAVNYLEKVVEIETIKSDNRWAKMKLINEIRNDFIHSSGYIGNSTKAKKYEAELGVAVVDGKITLLYEDIINVYNHIDEFVKFVFSRNFTNTSKSLRISVE